MLHNCTDFVTYLGGQKLARRIKRGAIINAAHRVVSAALASPQSSAKLSCNQRGCTCTVYTRFVFEGKDGDVPAGRRSPEGHIENRDSVCVARREGQTGPFTCRGRKIKTEEEEEWVIETKADEGRVECVLSDKQEHGSSLQRAPGEH